ncbi:helix-turn-helix transcriptional regulator [Pricia sp. S334]|uniref:Helix-turn-helix transcriptional regulator n=1 Tax=Pricia mediterranea TaxID=3076079 RepID=A0ABU3L479_9FLAO|nr:helix-turn-helix transcriptional regulator [Pricia sp. S334]MDT7828009.1 helix-turn-helix transcriptional regulator [Pricia sp. S334]
MDPSRSTNQKTYIHIAQTFLMHLRGQFPITQATQPIKLRKASDFADILNIHVNHLNRAVKLYTGKTTTSNINERYVKEARGLLKRTDWPITTIAIVFGFREANHFSTFFKKHVGCTPTNYRTIKIKK